MSLLPPSPSCSGKNHSCASFRHLRPEQARSCRLFVSCESDGGGGCLHDEMTVTVQDESSMQVSWQNLAEAQHAARGLPASAAEEALGGGGMSPSALALSLLSVLFLR